MKLDKLCCGCPFTGATLCAAQSNCVVVVLFDSIALVVETGNVDVF
jgi:hypothetical protein